MKETNFQMTSPIAPMILISLLIGCSDERIVEVSRQAAERQAQQNTTMAELHQEVASGTRALVQADAEARQEIVGIHHDLQQERTRLDSGWHDLETERQAIAGERRTESLLVPLVQLVGKIALVVVLLGFCWRALVGLEGSDNSNGELNELLVQELAENVALRLDAAALPAQITASDDRPPADS
jgi:hypothetical protein